MPRCAGARPVVLSRVGARMHVVTGKGGVGKSTVAAALALAAAARGQRVLALELGEPGGLGRCLGVQLTAPGVLVRAASGVHVGYVEGAAALGEYLLRRMHLGRLGRAIIAHPLYAAFVAAAPGLRELLTIGKVRDELVLQHRWDAVVVDAAASGHALEYLRMPAAAEATFARGRVHHEAAVNAALLRDPARCAIHVVATPEDMPLREAAATVTVLRDQALAVGRVIVNRCLPPAPPGVDALLEMLRPLAPAELRAALVRARAWEQIQERGVATLEAALEVTALRLPRLPAAAEATHARGLVAVLGPVLGEVRR